MISILVERCGNEPPAVAKGPSFGLTILKNEGQAPSDLH